MCKLHSWISSTNSIFFLDFSRNISSKKRCCMSDLTPKMAKKLNVYYNTQLFGLTLNEMRFMIYVVSSIRERELKREDIEDLLSFSVEGFKEVYGVTCADARRVFSRVAESFEAMEGEHSAWVDYIELNRNEISLMLSSKVKDLIFDEKRPLFNFQISDVIDLHSSIALRFYDFIYDNKLTNQEFYLSIDEVRDVCLAYSGSYQSVSNVRSKLVNQSIKLINKSTPLLLTVSRRCKETAGDFKFNCIKNNVL